VLRHLYSRANGARAIALLASYGPPGSGKSLGNVLMSMKLQEKLGGPKLSVKNLRHQLVFKPKDLPRMSMAAGRRRCMKVDEGSGEGANKMQQQTKENVELAIDLDAIRGREQPLFWAAPYKQDVSRQVHKHTTWVAEFNLDHSATFWEAEQMDPLFGKEPYLHERFTETRFPNLWDVAPDLARHYEHELKGGHNAGRDMAEEARLERQMAALQSRIVRILG